MVRRFITRSQDTLAPTRAVVSMRCARDETDVVTFAQRFAIDSSKRRLQLRSPRLTTCVPAYGGIE